MDHNNKYINIFAAIALLVVVVNVVWIAVLYSHLPEQMPIAFNSSNAAEPPLHHKIYLFIFPFISLLVGGGIYISFNNTKLRQLNSKYSASGVHKGPVKILSFKWLRFSCKSLNMPPTARRAQFESAVMGSACLLCALVPLLATFTTIYPFQRPVFQLIQLIIICIFIVPILILCFLMYKK